MQNDRRTPPKSDEQKRRDEIYKRLLELKRRKREKEARMREVKGK